MAKALVSDELWALVAPLLPPPRPRPKGGRPPVEDRKALSGILFVLKSGVLLDRLGRANAIDWSRCSLDSASVPAKGGARSPARTRPTAASRAPSATSWS